MSFKKFIYNKPFALENGSQLPELELAYTTLGQLNKDKSNVVWICHALTANSEPEEWWPGLVGPGKAFDTQRHFIVCANMLGSCYGSTNPRHTNPVTQKPYGKNFPLLTNRDIVRAMDLLREHLEIDRIEMAAGGSMGGQQILEWNVMQPDLFTNIFIIGTNATHSPWGIAFNEAQRMAMEADPTLWDDSPGSGAKGLEAARAIAMLSYRNYQAFDQTQQDDPEKLTNFRASTYQQYQGQKLSKRFDAQSYYYLTRAMDSHNIGRGRGGIEGALKTIKARALVVGIETDYLFPTNEQRLIAAHLGLSHYLEISTPYGHDGFLIEWDLLDDMVRSFWENHT